MANRATPRQKKNGRGKGVAFAKWAKIDKAQRNMLISVCVVSVFLGITLVGIIYFAKVIAFNAKVISEKDKIIANYKSIQSSLQSISSQVSEMSQSERLEAVARTRSSDCTAQILEGISNDEGIEDVELARTCTALRVIPDALPSKMNREATLASMNQLLLWSNGGGGIESISGADVGGVSAGSGDLTVDSIGVSISLSDEATNVRKSLDVIERSIRNFDIASANIAWVESYDDRGNAKAEKKIELNSTFRAYYATGVKIEKKSKKLCADDKSDKCTGRRSR